MFWRRPDPRDGVIALLTQQNADLMDRLQELVGSLHSYQTALHTRANLPGMPTVSISGEEASWVSEDEQDLRDSYEDGYIDEAAMKDALKELGFANTEVHFDSF